MIVKMVQTSKIVAALQINLPVLMEISVLNRGRDVTKDKIAGEIANRVNYTYFF